MLPVMIFEPDEATRRRVLDALDALGPRVRVEMSTASQEGIRRAIQSEKGIALVILGVHGGACAAIAALGTMAMRVNRDSYTLFFLHDPEDLDALLEACMRPAGILTAPFSEKSMRGQLTRILKDYQELTGAPEDEAYLVIEADATAYRLFYDQILYIEALEKKINIYTERQCLTVRRSLSSLEALLPEQFVRSHRAYLVNARAIDRADFGEMLLTLRTGEQIPISRAQRGAIKAVLDSRKGA